MRPTKAKPIRFTRAFIEWRASYLARHYSGKSAAPDYLPVYTSHHVLTRVIHQRRMCHAGDTERCGAVHDCYYADAAAAAGDAGLGLGHVLTRLLIKTGTRDGDCRPRNWRARVIHDVDVRPTPRA